MANSEQIETAAQRLRAAYDGETLAPLRETLAPDDGVTAYAIQDVNNRHWQGQGRRIIGRKIGLTAKAVQAQLGVDQPDYGVLFDDMLVEDGAPLPAGKLIQPKA